jgi:osmoprotectant transport system substrate-binding protein
MTMRKRTRSAAIIALGISLTAACAQADRRETPKRDPNAVRVASFDFSESEVLAEVYARALERRGFEVVRFPNLGSREVVFPALEQDHVDLVPEYLGSALEFATLGRTAPKRGTRAVHGQLAKALDQQGIDVLGSAPAQNKNVVVVARRVSRGRTLRTVSDLVPIAEELSFGGPPECPNRSLCLPGLKAVYGLEFKEFVPLDASGPLTTGALANGEVDVALMFSTDPALSGIDLKSLVDDKHLQPPENVIPIVRRDVVARHGPAFVRVLNAVSAELTTSDLRVFNQLKRSGTPVKDIAAVWLDSNGF